MCDAQDSTDDAIPLAYRKETLPCRQNISAMETPFGFDPVQVEVWRHLLASVAEEMGTTLERTAYSPNIKERLDYSCALFDSEGRLLAQAAHIPVHLGAMPLMLERLRLRVRWSPGPCTLTYDMFQGVAT